MYPNTYRCKIIRYFLDKRIKIGLKSPKQFNFDTLKHVINKFKSRIVDTKIPMEKMSSKLYVLKVFLDHFW